MKRISLPRLSLGFPLLLLGLVALSLMLEERNAHGAAGSSEAFSSTRAAEEAPSPREEDDHGEEDGQDTGSPSLPRDAGNIYGETWLAAGLPEGSAARQLRPGELDSGLPWRIGAPHPLELNTGFSSPVPGDSLPAIPAGLDRTRHPVRGPPAAWN